MECIRSSCPFRPVDRIKHRLVSGLCTGKASLTSDTKQESRTSCFAWYAIASERSKNGDGISAGPEPGAVPCVTDVTVIVKLVSPVLGATSLISIAPGDNAASLPAVDAEICIAGSEPFPGMTVSTVMGIIQSFTPSLCT